MTDEERRNRNPKVETTTMKLEDFEKIPELRTGISSPAAFTSCRGRG